MGTLALLHQLDGGKPKCCRKMGAGEYINLQPVDARTGQRQLPMFLDRLELVLSQGHPWRLPIRRVLLRFLASPDSIRSAGGVRLAYRDAAARAR